jgi:ABC-type branched-subunit amino acid transport system ATPase component
MLAIARALLTEPQLILLDEPTAGLSPKAAQELFALVRDLVKNGAAVLMIEQNAKAALRMSDRGYVLAEGQNRIDGPAAELLANPEIGEIFLGVRPGETTKGA